MTGFGGSICGGFGCTGGPQIYPASPDGPVLGVPEQPAKKEKEADANPEKTGNETGEKDKTKKKEGEKGGEAGLMLQVSLSPDRAKLIVTLPADAILFVDNPRIKTPSGVRVFQSPPLEPGQLYYYNLRAEVVRDGQTVTREQRVVVRGGSVTRAAFTDLPITSTLTVRAGDK